MKKIDKIKDILSKRLTFQEIPVVWGFVLDQKKQIDKLNSRVEDSDMRYRLALMLLVLHTNQHLDSFADIIDKTMGSEYWNFIKKNDNK